MAEVDQGGARVIPGSMVDWAAAFFSALWLFVRTALRYAFLAQFVVGWLYGWWMFLEAFR